jgi:peptidoglycan/LPS O-acetylase OafA/YrhL
MLRHTNLAYPVLQTRFWVWRYSILPSGLAKSADDLWAFAIDMAVCVPATFAVGCLSYHLVERPAAAAARRLEPLLFGSGGSNNDNWTSAADESKAKAA